ncbi:MAG: Ig domain-containing protein [Archangium sp.]
MRGVLAGLAVLMMTAGCANCGPAPEPLILEPTTVPSGSLGVPYAATFTVTNGTAPFSFRLASGDLPEGLTLDSEGNLAGTPLTAATSHFTITASDAAKRVGEGTYELVIAPRAITVSPAVLPNAVRGASYLAQLSATGGNNPYVYSIVSGSLPAGLSMTTAGAISGRPTASGVTTITFKATDLLSRTGEGAVRITVIDPMVALEPASLPNGTIGLDYDETLLGSGGADPYTFALESGSLPDGLTLGEGGGISGRPTTAGTSTFEVRVTDLDSNTITAMRSITIVAPAIAITPTAFTSVVVGNPFDVTLSASGGNAPYTFAVTMGTLPPGLTLTTAGRLSGTPTSIITTNIEITASDSASLMSSRAFTITITAATLVVSPAQLPSAQPGATYSQQLSADGGTGPYLFTVVTGSTPAGLTLSATGLISGTAAMTQTSNFTVQVADVYSSSVIVPVRVVVTPVVLSLSPSVLPDASVGVPFTQQFSADGGAGPYSFVLQSGALPEGLSFDAMGALSGTPSDAGLASFEVMGIDSNGATGSLSTSIDVQP